MNELATIASDIEKEKAALLGSLLDLAERSKVELAEAKVPDGIHTEQHRRNLSQEAADRCNAERAALIEDGVGRLKALYEKGASAATKAYTAPPSEGEFAYLQAFRMRSTVMEADLRQAEAALAGNATALAAAYDHAAKSGLSVPSLPSYIQLLALAEECAEAAEARAREACRIVRDGGFYSFQGNFAASLAAKYPGDDFTAALRALGSYVSAE